MVKVAKDVTATDGSFIATGNFIGNDDGTTSLQMSDGTYLSQVPNVYGSFAPGKTEIGVYEKFSIDGQLITFWTRPQDKAYSYTWVNLPNY